MDTLDAWTKHFKKQAEIFGLMLSKDIAFCASQAVYRKKSKLDFADGNLVIDLSAVDGAGALGLSDTFYMSAEKSLVPKALSGGTLSLYETHGNFHTYEIKRSGESFVKIAIKNA